MQGDGTVMFDAVLSRAGVFKYLNTDGTSRSEYRPVSEVFAPESMRSFEGMAVTDYHPNGVPVTIENRTDLARGYIVPGSLRRDGFNLIGTVHITDANLIRAVMNGRTAVSLGYFQDRIAETGTATEDGQPYKFKQTNIRGNHAAIVDEARAGDVARLQVDSLESQEIVIMEELKKALAELLTAQTEVNKQKMRIDALEADVSSTKKTLSTVEAERDTLKDKLDKSEKLRTDGESKAMATARARVTLESVATKVLTVDGAAPKFDGESDRKIRERVIVKLTGKDIPAGKDDSYIEARFDHLVEDSTDRASNDQRNVRQFAPAIVPRETDSDPAVSALRQDGSYDLSKMSAADCQKMNADRDANRWQTKKQNAK